jgi:hypothetical protein
LQRIRAWSDTRLRTEHISNADETRLSFSLLPSKTFSMKGETSPSDAKKAKNILLLLYCNSNNSEKLKILVTGKHAQPRYHQLHDGQAQQCADAEDYSLNGERELKLMF